MTCPIAPKSLILAACMSLASLVHAGQGPEDNNQLKDALHAILMHGDLADLPELSAELGLGLRLHRAESRIYPWLPACCLAIATAAPPALIASGLSWSAVYNDVRGDTRIDLSLIPRDCVSLKEWAKEWQLSRESSPLIDAAGSSEAVHWPGAGGIALAVTRQGGGPGSCTLALVQMRRGRLTLTPPDVVSPPIGGFDASQLVAIAKSGDLRHYETISHILGAEFLPDYRAVRGPLLFKGGILLGTIIPGLDPELFQYYGNDSGWQQRPSLTYQPQTLAERKVTLVLVPDIEARCITVDSVEREIRRQRLDHLVKESDGYAIAGENRISFGFTPVHGCIARFDYAQITDPKEHLAAPVVFFTADSLKGPAIQLTENARRKLKLFRKKARALPEPLSEVSSTALREIRVSVCLVSEVDAERSGPINHLAEAIQHDLIAGGFDSAVIHENRGGALQMGLDCSSLEGEKSHLDYVAPDAWAD
jgi:hypothetical protein